MLSQIFEDVQARVQGTVELDVPLEFLGPDRKSEDHAPPVIAWAPVSAVQSVPPRGASRLGGRDEEGLPDEGILFVRIWKVNVEFWGRDLDEAEKLVNAFVQVMCERVSMMGYRPGAEVWLPPATLEFGAGATLTMELVTPIPKAPIPTARVETINFTKDLRTE